MKLAWLAPAHSIHTVRWVNALVAEGHEVHLISFDDFSPLLDKRVLQYPLPFHGRVGRWFNIFAIKRILKSVGPKILHSHYVSDYSALGLLSGFHPHIGTAWGADVYEYPYLRQWHIWIIRKVLAHVDALTSTSVAMADQMLRVLNQKRVVEIIPFGIDTQKFAPSEQKDESVFRVGMFKSLEKTYGVDRALRSFASFHQTFPKSELILAGDGPQRREYQALAHELNIQTVVHFVGRLSPDQVANTLKSIHVVLNLSRYESFGVAIVEALASEVPVVATRVGGIPELVEHGTNGYLVSLETAEKTVPTYLLDLARDPALRQRLGKQGRAKMTTHFDVKIGLQKMLNLYERMTYESR